MKKLSKIIFSFIAFIALASTVNAAKATISVYTSRSQVITGNNLNVTVTVSSSEALGVWDFSLRYDTSKFSIVSGGDKLHVVTYADNNSTKKVSYNYTFKAKKSGSAKFYISDSSALSFNEEQLDISNGSRTVKVITYQDLIDSYSKNNYLKSLSVEGYELDKPFNKNTSEYSVVLPPETKSIKILGSKEDSKADISGLGTKEVSQGLNKFTITVTAENGKERKYTLNVTVKELEPIIVNINNKDYTVVRQKEALKAPSTFTETKTVINGEEVPAFKNEIIKTTLIGLKDEQGKIELYSYDEQTNTYSKYNEIKFGTFSVIPKDYTETIEGYQMDEKEINGVKVKVFLNPSNPDFLIFNGLNTETAKTHLYKYDIVENTIQRFDNVIMKDKKIEKNYLIVMALFGGGLVLSMIIIITLLSTKFSGNYKNKQVKKMLNDEVWHNEGLNIDPEINKVIKDKEIHRKNKHKNKKSK